MTAVKLNRLSTLRLVLRYGADTGARNANGTSVRDIAVSAGPSHSAVVDFLGSMKPASGPLAQPGGSIESLPGGLRSIISPDFGWETT